MVQQVNRIPIQQKAKEPARAVQSSEDKGDFEALMKKTVSNLKNANKKPVESVKHNEDDVKDSDPSIELTDAAAVPAGGTDISSLAALFQQFASPQLTVVESQATGSLQLPISQVVSAPGTAIPSSAQETGPLAGATSGSAAGVQMNTGSLGAQGTSIIANTGEAISTAPQINPVISNSIQAPEVVNAPLSNAITAQTLQTAPQSQVLPQGQVLPQTQILPQSQIPVLVQQGMASPAQNVLEVQQQAVQINQTAVYSSQSVFEAQQKAATQTKQNVDSSPQSALGTLQGVLNTETKTSVPVQAAGYQDQNTTQFADLFQAGNVVIKVSDTSSNATKTTCNQVADNISVNFKAGNPEFQMDLYPQDLGKVSIKMAMQSGVLTVEILAADPKTQSMLMANTNEIKAMLQNTITQPVQIMEQTQDKQWYQQQQDQPDQSPQQQKQDQNARSYLNALNGDITTDDFLTVMQQLRQQAYSV